MSTSLDADDIELRKLKTISFFGISMTFYPIHSRHPASAIGEAAIHDVLAQEIGPRTSVPYYHINPRLVITNAMDTNKVGIFFRLLVKFLWRFVGYTPDQWAPVPVSVVLNRPTYTTIGDTGKEAPVKRAIEEPELRNKVLAFLKHATGVEIAGN